MKKLSDYIIIFLFLLAACGNQHSIKIDANNMKIVAGEVTAYAIENGQKGRILDSNVISADNITLNIKNTDNPILIELKKARFRDFASDTITAFGSEDLWSAVLGDLSDATNTVQINPLTTMGSALALYKLKYSIDELKTVKNSINAINDHFRINMQQEYPEDPDEYQASTDIDIIKYNLILAGLSQLANDIFLAAGPFYEEDSLDVVDLTTMLIDDIQFDGILNGIDITGKIKAGDYEFSQNTLKEDLVSSIRKYMSENGIDETDQIYTFLQQLINSSSELIYQGFSFDVEAPVLGIISPCNGQYVSGETQVLITAKDESPIVYLDVFLRSDDNYISLLDTDPDDNNFQSSFLSYMYPDGQFSLKVEAYDINGNYSEKYIAFNIDNTLPSFTTNIQDGMKVSGNLGIEITVSDSEGSGGKEAKIINDGTIVDSVNFLGSSHAVIHIDTTQFPDAYNKFDLQLIDKAGNVKTEEYNLFFENYPLSEHQHISYNITASPSNPEGSFTGFAGDLNLDGYPEIITTHNTEFDNVHLHLGNSNVDYLNNIVSINNYPNSNIAYDAKVATKCRLSQMETPGLILGDSHHPYLNGAAHAFIGELDQNNSWHQVFNYPGYNYYDPFGSKVVCMNLTSNSIHDLVVDIGGMIAVYETVPHITNYELINQGNNGEIYNAGDINNDGFDDLVFGERLILGAQAANDINRSLNHNLWQGYNSFSALGDINSDNYDDILVGKSSDYIPDGRGYGTVKAYLGHPSSFILATTIRPPYVSDGFAKSITAGYIDGDQDIDIVISAPNNSYDSFDEAGEVFIFWGPSYDTYMILRSPNPYNHAHFGLLVESMSDVNLDGKHDLLVSEPGPYSLSTHVGSFYVFNDEKP